MKQFLLFIGLVFIMALTSTSQNKSDLKKFVRNPNNAVGTIQSIDSLVQILSEKFIIIANNSKTKTHKNLQSFFNDYKINSQNKEYNVYPTTLRKEHLSIQFLDYSTNYGWVGQGVDSVYNSDLLTALIIIPAFDNIHKGQVVNTLSFKATLKVYSESNMKSQKEYLKKQQIIDLKRLEL